MHHTCKGHETHGAHEEHDRGLPRPAHPGLRDCTPVLHWHRQMRRWWCMCGRFSQQLSHSLRCAKWKAEAFAQAFEVGNGGCRGTGQRLGRNSDPGAVLPQVHVSPVSVSVHEQLPKQQATFDPLPVNTGMCDSPEGQAPTLGRVGPTLGRVGSSDNRSASETQQNACMLLHCQPQWDKQFTPTIVLFRDYFRRSLRLLFLTLFD